MKAPSYEIHREYRNGYTAAIGMTSYRDDAQTQHWLRGWDDGYKARKRFNEGLDEYLLLLGYERQATIVPAERKDGDQCQ